MVEEKTELYVLVAGDARVRSPTLCIFLAEVIDYILLELILQVDEVERYAEAEAGLLSVNNALCRRARAALTS